MAKRELYAFEIQITRCLNIQFPSPFLIFFIFENLELRPSSLNPGQKFQVERECEMKLGKMEK